jgi:hypothetical protein
MLIARHVSAGKYPRNIEPRRAFYASADNLAAIKNGYSADNIDTAKQHRKMNTGHFRSLFV